MHYNLVGLMFLKYPLYFFLLVSQWIICQELPPIQNYTPADYQAENQNWAISQDDDKVVYVANNKGLLRFNGANWMLFPSPNESIMRSVKVVGNRIYTGCYMEFGYWIEDGYGVLRYTSLSSSMEESLLEDEEFWGISNLDDWMVFQSLKRIYIYNIKTGAINIIDAENTLFRMFQVDKEIYFQESGKGIFKIDNGKAEIVYEDEVVLNDEVINIFQQGGTIVLVTKHNGFFTANDGFLTKFNTGLDSLVNKVSVYSAIRLKDGKYALGTISNGLVLLDRNGALQNHIDQIKGLRNNTILSLMEDIDSNIWLGLDNGISYINVKSPVKVYHDNKGVVGSTYAAAIKDNILYLGTNQGLFYKPLEGESDFQLIKGTQGQVWSLQEIEGTLFCCHHSGTFVVEGDSAKQITSLEGAWKINPLSGNPDLLLQGNYDGLYVLEKERGNWKLRNKVEGFENSSRYFEILGNKVFVNHEYKGIFKLDVDSSFYHVQSIAMDTLIKGPESGIVKYRDQLFYAYKEGVFKYQPDSDSFVQDTLLSGIYNEDDYVSGKMVLDQNEDNLWIFTNSNISLLSDGSLADTLLVKPIPLAENVRDGIVGYENIVNLGEEGKYLLGTTSGYITLDVNTFQEPDLVVQIGRIQKSSKDSQSWASIEKGSEVHLKSSENHLRFSFFTAEYNKYFQPKYQFQLQGIYDNWSDWSENYSTTFENLPYGDYTFRVRAKIGDKVSSNIATYSFRIERPWYISNLMLVIYILVFAIGSFLIHQAYKRYYHKRQQKLIEKNKREIELAKAQNEKEIIKIKNEQLQEEFRSKSNELAASTLSIIRKNELLSKVKDQLLSSVEDKGSIKPIIKVIDKNITQNDDWELFKEAFNNADRKFLKKLKKAHPNLSPNDVRLCAYLRLNLSSKEIAPLFNISVRSVEIKRYRLRKKMDLSHDDNLVDYILKL
ncbi:triple tyrosine motif-containing protein [Flagellimonas sp.]|jgi:AraC family chitin signaling transcriptional activator|uniref:helix-turn-helix and ligand-binding sensor domain-containing protein n=1 Tax=Flagellimonas sp. TaxID=2058762 RepID=UPI003BA97EFE